jgi:hypothetical protein
LCNLSNSYLLVFGMPKANVACGHPRSRNAAEGALALFAQAMAWLRRHRVLLPGVSTLARLVSQVRDQAAERMYRTLAEAATSADAELPYRLRDLLTIPDGQRVSGLELLRRAPIRTSGIAMNKALERATDACRRAVDRDAYVLRLLDQLRAALRRRDVFARPSLRCSDPRVHLLDGADWLAVRDEVLAGLGLGEPVEALRTRQFGHDLNPALPPPPPGALAGGANSRDTPGFPTDPRLQRLPPQCCYLDEPTSETTNDICIRWNAPLAYIASYLSLTSTRSTP